MIEKFIKKQGTQTIILNPEWIKKNYPDTVNMIKREIIQEISLKGYGYQYSDNIGDKEVLVDVYCLPKVDWEKLKKRHLPNYANAKHNNDFKKVCPKCKGKGKIFPIYDGYEVSRKCPKCLGKPIQKS